MEYLITGFFALLGLIVGSFLNVVILRFGFSERASARSRCAACLHTLSMVDLIPALSYLGLRGRCRHCGSAISTQYVLVEVTLAALFGLSYWMVPHATVYEMITLLATLGFWTALLGLVVYDIRHTLIPMPFVWWLVGFAAVSAAASLSPLDHILGAILGGAFFAFISIVTGGKGMGIGDAYVAFGIGLMFGIVPVAIISALGVWSGAALGLALIGLHKVVPHKRLLIGGGSVTLKSELPFAPFLALGALVYFLI